MSLMEKQNFHFLISLFSGIAYIGLLVFIHATSHAFSIGPDLKRYIFLNGAQKWPFNQHPFKASCSLSTMYVANVLITPQDLVLTQDTARIMTFIKFNAELHFAYYACCQGKNRRFSFIKSNLSWFYEWVAASFCLVTGVFYAKCDSSFIVFVLLTTFS